jgi:hypothetical protein
MPFEAATRPPLKGLSRFIVRPLVRYWVRAGVSGVMFRLVRAICSMRSFLPSVDWSSWSWAQSMSSWREVCCRRSSSMNKWRAW